MKYFSLILLVSIISSCNIKNGVNEKIAKAEIIDVLSFDNKLTANKSDLFDSVSIIPLKTTSP